MLSILLSTISNPEELQFITKLWEEHKELMYNAARKHAHDLTLCDDIVQESLTKLIEKVSILRNLERYQLSSYIVKTVKNTARNEYRKSLVRCKYQEPIPEELVDPISLEDMHQVLFRKYKLSAVWNQLDEDEKLLLEGKTFLGLTDKEVAQILGCQTDSVRMKRTRARRHAIELILQLED